MTTDITELAQAAEKYRLTLEAHRQNPRNYDALDAWDKASSEFMALVNNDELNIISSLLDKLETEEGYRKGAFLACNRWHNKFRQTEDKLEAAERRNAELVEALEKAQTKNELVTGGIAVAEKLRERIAYLEKRLRGTEESLIASTDMVAELESRTVKLPEVRITIAEAKLRNLTHQQHDAYNAGASRAVAKISQELTVQGIKVEAE
ncbi:hypothetical protein PGN04_27975 [Klebsiella quasipneumoniae subsp. quasipneumoniae]|uniref:hypothetical protein n=1 Tax=Klebsiella quasipneumoniae TaxID=1463165 RepID=UPI0022F0DA97|nr:hypothetical protein [Klebsiella quasipneumoniae]MDA5091669.1 hypothetical protein [Klebsiella quasipneumoniae subsp. quasipneumoniae]